MSPSRAASIEEPGTDLSTRLVLLQAALFDKCCAVKASTVWQEFFSPTIHD